MRTKSYSPIPEP